MKRFISTKLFLVLQEASQKGVDVGVQALENGYDEFVIHVFHESAASTDMAAYHNTLVYTQVELKSLTKVSKKNAAIYVHKGIELVCIQIEWVQRQMLTKQTPQNCPYNREIQTKLQWTGSMVDLVELLYALRATKCINGGKITLKEIFDSFCGLLDVDIRNFSRFFISIKNRMKGDRTAFLDELKKALTAKLEESDRKPSRK
jgi:hypothetical protein